VRQVASDAAIPAIQDKLCERQSVENILGRFNEKFHKVD